MATWKKWCITLACIVVAAAGLWLGNLLKWANLPSPLKCFQPEVEVVVEEAVVEEVVVEETVVEASETVTE